MRALNNVELNQVNGGNPLVVIPIVIGVVGAVIKFSYDVGKDMAERDNALNAAE